MTVLAASSVSAAATAFAIMVVGLWASSVAVHPVSGFVITTTLAKPAATAATATVAVAPLLATTTTTTAASNGGDTAVAATTVSSNPLLDQDGLPKFESIRPEDLTPAVNSLLERLDADFHDFEAKMAAKATSEGGSPVAASSASTSTVVTYDDVLPVLERMQYGLGYAWGVAGHLNGVQNGDDLRRAYEQNQPNVVKAMTQFSQSKPLYDALETISVRMKTTGEEEGRNNDDDDDDDFEAAQRQRAVDGSLLSMRLGGVGLTGADKDLYNEKKMRLAELSTKFSNNVLDATKVYSMTITDPSEMEGVPHSAKAMWANAHVMAQEIVSSEAMEPAPALDPDAGPWRVTHDMPSYIAAMQHLPSRTLREEIYRASISRAGESMPELNNVPLIYEILSLKADMAKLLGFANHAEKSLASKMAPSVQAVTDLSELIRTKALPAAEKELAEITAFAREHGGTAYSSDRLERLMPWDITYWSERLKESKFDLKEEDLRPYFALPNVLEGMFGLLGRLFGVTVKEAPKGTVEVWHPDVQFFDVYDDNSADGGEAKKIAGFYLDPFSRPENKRGGAWMDVCVGRSDAVGRDVPVAYLTCNGSPPVGDRPSLMTFREVETLFHETGHGLQHMLTKASVGDVAGINGVEWDAVELPSQFMENWCYDRPTVYGFAKHWETGEPLPEEMFEKLKEQKIYGAGMMACRQLLFGQLDMELHSTYDAAAGATGEGESVFDVHRRMAERYSPYSLPLPEDRFLCTFGHIFAGGYSAGYYSYKWAEVMSADAFGAFEEVGLDDEEKVAEVGRRFRDTVLGLGGGVEPMEVFKRFRGREPSPEALLRHNGFA